MEIDKDTFLSAAAEIEKRIPAAGDVLRMSAFLASDGIPEEIFLTSISEENLNAALDALQDSGIIQRDEPKKMFRIRPEIQAFTRDYL